MGTNATRKAASKIVAILLAALMLISVMPMSAFAASVSANIIVDGLTLTGIPDNRYYAVGDEFDISGVELEVTFQLASDIKENGEAAKRYAATIDETEFVKYGITANYKNGQVLKLEDNLVSLVFNYGTKGELEFDTNWYPVVFPNAWDCGTLVERFAISGSDVNVGVDDGKGEYVIVANDKVMLSGKDFEGKNIIGNLKVGEVLATYDVKVGTGKTITDILDKVPADVELADVSWIIDNTVEKDEDGNYVISWKNVDSAQALSSIIEEANASAFDEEWPLLASDEAVEWKLTKDGKMFITVLETYLKEIVNVSDSDVSGSDEDFSPSDAEAVAGVKITIEYEVATREIPVYVAVKDGYAYLTTDAAKAAKISVYRLGLAEVDDIEIAKNADKMTYFEGEYFDATGMVVNLIHNDKVVLCVPSEYFDVYGIYVEPSCALNVQRHNDNVVKVHYYGNDQENICDTSDTRLTVLAKGQSQATIPSGKLVDGDYVIAWFDYAASDLEKGKFVADKAYFGNALVAYNDSFIRAGYESTYDVATLSATPVQALDNQLGYFSDSYGYSSIDNSMIWTVKFAGVDGYTIQQASTGKYLTRSELTYSNLWVDDLNAGDDATAIKAEVKPLVLAKEVSENAYWDIDGLFNAAIQSKAANEDDNYYVINTEEGLGLNAFLAADLDNAEAVDFAVAGDNFYFFKTADINITAIEIIDAELLKDLKSGDKLDLHDLVVTLVYSDGTTVNVPYDDFASYGITCNYEDGQILAASDNGKKLTVSVNGKSDSVALNVADSTSAAKVVRMGGADRYETAAIIANNYITALGAEYKNVAVLVNSERFPDALAGSTLAAALKAPIVISKADSLNAKTKAVLVDNKVNTVYVLGGENAIGASVIAELKALNINVKVIAGADRVETSIAIAKELAAIKGASETVIITNGANFADALSVSSAAAKNGTPILYVNGQGTLSESVKTFIAGAKKAVILGGTAAVSDGIAAELAALGLTVDRAAGADRFETSVAIAKYFDAAYTDGVVALATGKDFPDALAGGVYASLIGAPVILVDNGYANADAALYIAGLDLTNAVVFGGPEAVSDATVAAALLK